MTAVLAVIARAAGYAVLGLAALAFVLWAALSHTGLALVPWLGVVFVTFAGIGAAAEWLAGRRRKGRVTRDPVMDRVMDVNGRPPCRCDFGREPCARPSVPGDLLCAACIAWCVPLGRGKNPFAALPGGPGLACPGCGSPDADLRRGLLCGTCAEAAAGEGGGDRG